MTKSGLADSPFFVSPQAKEEVPASPLPIPDEIATEKLNNVIAKSPILPEPTITVSKLEKIKEQKKAKVKQPSNRDTTVSRHHDTETPLIHGVMIESVRKAVKEFGKEAATHRFTQAEKKEVGDLIYTYKNLGIKTSENEITRIAVNFVVEDYKENGENSVLYKILRALKE